MGGRPIIIDRTIYGFPFGWDLLTGRQKTTGQATAGRRAAVWKIHGKSFGCAPQTGSANLIVMRSGTPAYFALQHDNGWQESVGGVRPGCWVNALPVGGLLRMPDDTRGCRCSYVNQATVSLQQYGVRPPIVFPRSEKGVGSRCLIIGSGSGRLPLCHDDVEKLLVESGVVPRGQHLCY